MTKQELQERRGDVPGLLHVLRSWMQGQAADVMDIFDTWDANGSRTISEAEFERGLHALGYVPPPLLVRAIFDAIDADATFRIGFAELHAWLVAE